MGQRMKRFLTIPVVFALLLSMVSSASGMAAAKEKKELIPLEDYVNGYIPVYKEMYNVQRQSAQALLSEKPEEDFPAAYRSDEQPWAANIKIKDQMRTSLCWAFSLTTCAEYSYAKELYETTGKLYDGELSPGHLGQFLYNHVMDPLENTEGDYNDVPAGNHFALYGGTAVLGMQHLATWSGAVSEAEAPLDLISQHIVKRQNEVWDSSILPYSSSLAYGHNELILEESVCYFVITPAVIKELILQYGACEGSMGFDYVRFMNLDEIDPETGKKYRGGRSFYNETGAFSANHAVTIVGWDDNYPKENFAREVTVEDEDEDEEENEKVTKTVMPKNDGAWIVQNSWGENTHDHGFFYASYETADFTGDVADIFAFNMQPADTYDYNFHYDGNALSTDSSDRDTEGVRRPYWTTPGTWAANVYTNTTGHPINLEAVGYTTFNLGLTNYDVSIYTGLTDPKDPTSGTLQGTSRVTSTRPGCKTGKLDQPVRIRAGETYSIVFHFTDFTAFGFETTSISLYYIFKAQIDEGQCFFKPARCSAGWEDMAEQEICFRIKGFATIAEEEEEEKTAGPFTDVKEGKYYYEPVLWAYSHDPQITSGVTETAFGPGVTCTRGQVVTFLWRANGCPEPAATVNPFTDVKEDKYYYKAVLWAVEKGIASGTGKTAFSPGAPCTRAQVVTFLWRSAGSPAPTVTANPFRDVPAGQYYRDAVLWAVEKGITKGTSDTAFSPKNSCTRGQVVTFLYWDQAQ